MDFYLHLSCSLKRQLKRTSENNKISDSAKLKCRQLLCDIREYGFYHEKVACKRTKKGEQRIKNCVKYDMGGGYRLVTIMNGKHLFVTFLGSHDETDIWFDRHKRDDFVPENPDYNVERIHIAESANRKRSEVEKELVESDDYEAQLEAKLDETILLSIFHGLNRNRQVVDKQDV